MALRCGTRANKPDDANENRRDSSGRPAQPKTGVDGPAGPAGVLLGMGFVLMLALALAVVAGVVLLPPYAKLQQEKYRRDCDALRVAEAQATVEAMDRMLAEAPSDEVLTKRLAWSRLGLYPAGEQVARTTGRGFLLSGSPGTLSVIRYPDPPPPDPWLMSLAEKLNQPARRRGLMVLAGCLAVAAMLLLAGKRKTGNRE